MTGSRTPTATATTPPEPYNVSYAPGEFKAWKTAFLGATNALMTLIAVRLILLCGVLGAIGLTFLALRDPDLLRLAVLGVYAAVVVVPLVWLAARG
jgi:uncharacterized membrane protein